jgi:hypothetical protein
MLVDDLRAASLAVEFVFSGFLWEQWEQGPKSMSLL